MTGDRQFRLVGSTQLLIAIRIGLSCITLLMFSATALCQTSEPDPSALLVRARTRLMADMNRQARYTCVQDVMRRHYKTTSKQPQSCTEIAALGANHKRDLTLTSWDHLQLDVGIADNREIHAWPGESKFAEDDIREMAGSGGPFGSGDFAAFIVGVFGEKAQVKFANSHAIHGQQIYEYTFTVTQSDSNYGIARGGSTAAAAYSGSFLLDAKTADLDQLTVQTAEFPGDAPECEAISKIEYQRIDVHGQSVIVPRQTDLRIIYRDGSEASGITSYSACHEYSSKATLKFDDLDDSASDSTKDSVPIPKPLPMDLRLECRITTAINSDTPAGNPIQAVLLSPLRGNNDAVVAPPGSIIGGRLIHVGQHLGKGEYFDVGVRLDSIMVNGTKLPLYATLFRQPEPPNTGSTQGGHEAQFSDLLSLPRNIGVFFFVGKHLQVSQWDSVWLTTYPDAPKIPQLQPFVATGQAISQLTNNQKFLLAMQYAKQAADLLNGRPSVHPFDNPKLPDVLNARKEAIEVGRSIDIDALNDLYAGLGDEFRNELLTSFDLFVHGCEMRTQSQEAAKGEIARSVLLADEWSRWYSDRQSDIEDAIRHRPQ